MWTLNQPQYSAQATFAACISRVRDPVLKARLAAATPTVEATSAAFDTAARHQALHTITRHPVVAPDVTTKEMDKVYTQRMAKKKAPGRDVYDDIFASSPHGRCPLCAHRAVATLDHHLPKAEYPALAVAPLNLVPACTDCNKAKLNAVPQTAEEVSLHPYYDDLGSAQWLFARVVQTRPAAIRFRLVAPGGWNDVLTARVRNHLRVLGLAALYASEAAEELVHIRHQLVDLHIRGGLGEVRAELDSRANSSAQGRPKGWRFATYRAWADSDWFCDGGFAA